MRVSQSRPGGKHCAVHFASQCSALLPYLLPQLPNGLFATVREEDVRSLLWSEGCLVGGTLAKVKPRKRCRAAQLAAEHCITTWAGACACVSAACTCIANCIYHGTAVADSCSRLLHIQTFPDGITYEGDVVAFNRQRSWYNMK